MTAESGLSQVSSILSWTDPSFVPCKNVDWSCARNEKNCTAHNMAKPLFENEAFVAVFESSVLKPTLTSTARINGRTGSCDTDCS